MVGLGLSARTLAPFRDIVKSAMIRSKQQLACSGGLLESVTVQHTAVVPTGKKEPEAGEHEML